MIHGCQHDCVNTEGSYRCSCKVGYSLQLDGKTCLAQGSINPCLLLFIYNLSTFKGGEREITREREGGREPERGGGRKCFECLHDAACIYHCLLLFINKLSTF